MDRQSEPGDLFTTARQRLDFYRGEMRFQVTELSNKINSFLTAQSFLIIAYSSSMANLNPHWGEVYTLVASLAMALFGILSSFNAWSEVKHSYRAIDHWFVKQEALMSINLTYGVMQDDGPLLTPSAEKGHFNRYSIAFSRRLPILFIFLWLILGMLTLWLHLSDFSTSKSIIGKFLAH